MHPIPLYFYSDSGLINYLYKPANLHINSIVAVENHNGVNLNVFSLEDKCF